MLRRPTRRTAALVGFGALFLAAARLAAQGQLASMADLKAGHNESSLRVNNLASGIAQPTSADQGPMDKEAKYFVHRFHAGKPDEMHQFQKEFEAFIFRTTNLP